MSSQSKCLTMPQACTPNIMKCKITKKTSYLGSRFSISVTKFRNSVLYKVDETGVYVPLQTKTTTKSECKAGWSGW